jgi:hypothetical protein
MRDSHGWRNGISCRETCLLKYSQLKLGVVILEDGSACGCLLGRDWNWRVVPGRSRNNWSTDPGDMARSEAAVSNCVCPRVYFVL